MVGNLYSDIYFWFLPFTFRSLQDFNGYFMKWYQLLKG